MVKVDKQIWHNKVCLICEKDCVRVYDGDLVDLFVGYF